MNSKSGGEKIDRKKKKKEKKAFALWNIFWNFGILDFITVS